MWAANRVAPPSFSSIEAAPKPVTISVQVPLYWTEGGDQYVGWPVEVSSSGTITVMATSANELRPVRRAVDPKLLRVVMLGPPLSEKLAQFEKEQRKAAEESAFKDLLEPDK